MADAPHLLIVEARFYDDMADAILEGATDALKDAGASYEVVTVDGALEIPATIAMALDGMEMDGTHYDGFIALGVVIRLTQLSVSESIALGNGIMTVENADQAWARVKKTELNKGGFAARAALKMIQLKEKFSS